MESGQKIQNISPSGDSVRDDDAHAVHLAVRMIALEVVHPGSTVKAANPTVGHDAVAVGTSGHDIGLAIRTVNTLVLDLETPSDGMAHVAGRMTNSVGFHYVPYYDRFLSF